MKPLALFLLHGLLAVAWILPGESSGAPQDAQPLLETTVGIAATWSDVVIPGPELEALPADFKSPIVLRITSVRPHGEHFRYDFEVQALEPGDYDLADWLRPRGSVEALEARPSLPLHVRSLLSEGRIEPHAQEEGKRTSLGGYRRLGITLGALWVLGLLALLFVARRRAATEAAEGAAPRTLADRLRPLVQSAMQGSLSRAERSRLELSLVAYWRARLDLDQVPAAEAMEALREHPEAGPLLKSLEEWLHVPEPRRDLDLAALLAPYRDLPADAMDSLPEPGVAVRQPS